LALVAGLFDGRAYLNIHTTAFPNGEIRGFPAVPGPIAGAGLPALMALGGFVWARRRKAAAVA
jgi:LPXTG-motif cell wall-anchored protein